jgi:hypothetical protein
MGDSRASAEKKDRGQKRSRSRYDQDKVTPNYT